MTLGPPSRFAHASRPVALVVLAAFAAVFGWGLAEARTAPDWRIGADAIPDRDIYREIVRRVHAGENYYDALGAVLGPGGGMSTFNWRPPTYAWGLGGLPDPGLGHWLLLALTLAGVAVGAGGVLAPPGTGRVGTLAGMVLLMGGAFAWTIYEPEAYLTTEPWCEALLLLSLGAYARGRWPAGVAAALLALVLRELVLPYCGVAALLAVWHRRWREVAAWGAGLAAAGGLFALHVGAVAAHKPAVATAAGGWVQFAGLGPLLGSGAMNVFLYPLPAPARAATLAAALVGLAGWRGESGTRVGLSAAGYVVPLLIVRGWDYWGFLFTPMLVLGLVKAPAAFRDLARAVAGRSPEDVSAATSRGDRPHDS